MRSKAHMLTAALVAAAVAAPSAQAMPARDTVSAAKPIRTVQTQPPPQDDGFPWGTLTFVLAGSGLVLTGAGTFAGVRRRSHRPGVLA